MELKEIIKSQHHASLEMLKQAVADCPDTMWNDPAYKNRFWRVAYHAIFYAHLYLQPSEAHFVPWEKHRENINYMGAPPQPQFGQPYTKAEVLDYLALFRAQIDATVDKLDLEGESGFSWISLGKMELQFYSIRHVQQHTGELCERLGTKAGIDVDWVGKRPKSQ